MTAVNSHFVVAMEEQISQMLTFLECVVLSRSLYNYSNTITLFNFGE